MILDKLVRCISAYLTLHCPKPSLWSVIGETPVELGLPPHVFGYPSVAAIYSPVDIYLADSFSAGRGAHSLH